jgi:hypothetical protein
MYPERLPADAWMQDASFITPVDRGWARAIRRGPVTVDQALAAGLARMLDEDAAERRQRDPVAWARAPRRRTLLARLLCR